MEHDAIRLGSMLFTIVEPKKGHEVGYNRWYERDHFYSGCMIGPWTLAGGRFVATRDCKALRYPDENEITGSAGRGSYVALYWIQDGHFRDWIEFGGAQVMWLHENGRMFAEREHVHTQLYRYRWGAFRDDDGVPAELALDHRFPGLVTVFGQAAEGVDPADVDAWYRDEHLPAALADSPIAMCLSSLPKPLQQGPSDVPRQEGSERNFLHLYFCDDDPRKLWADHFADHGGVFEKTGLGTITFASPWLVTVPGTDTYTDQLW
jgi:hypothetical protein